jgi:hypothetical protein
MPEFREFTEYPKSILPIHTHTPPDEIDDGWGYDTPEEEARATRRHEIAKSIANLPASNTQRNPDDDGWGEDPSI